MADASEEAAQLTLLDGAELERLRGALLPGDEVALASEFFKALGDPTRILIVNALQQREWLCVSDLAALLKLSPSAVSHQLGFLRLNKLVKVSRDGKRVFYALNDDHVERVFSLTISHIRE